MVIFPDKELAMKRVQANRISLGRILLGLPALMLMSGGAHADTPATGPTFGQWGVETRYIAQEIAPGDDFYRHVNKGWLESAQIPAGLPMTGAFVDLALKTEQQVQAIIDEVKAQPASAGTPAQQIADMHASFVNMERRNALGSSMLQTAVTDILQLTERSAFARRMGSIGYTSPVGLGVDQDPGDPKRYVLWVGQSGLGLPGRDYYLKQEEPYTGFRSAYLDYIEGVFQRAGVADGKTKAAAILAFETRLAATQWIPEQLRDAVKVYHPMSVRALARYAPGLDWPAFLAGAGFSDVKRVNVGNDTAVKAAAALLGRTSIDTLRAYSAFHYLDNRAPLLSQAWTDAHFDFYMRRLAGIAVQRPIDKRALDLLAQPPMAEQIGKLYAERFFPAESKAAMDKLVTFLRVAFRERLAQSDWMDAPTRKAAMAKLDAITVKIGYPDTWHDFSTVQVFKDDLVGNMIRYEEWVQKDARAMLKGPVRKWEWSPRTMPQVVNAYYTQSGNEIVFPAAILQPPFFDPKADPAVNFGAIGMVIGHEIGHGFDDQGNRYDGKGALRNWWTDKARRNFELRAKGLAAQYDQFSPLPGLNLSGKLTLGENIGDLGGMAIAWSGYQKLVASDYAGKAPVIDGYSGNQRFFLGYGQLWRSLYTDGFLRRITLTDPHSPGEFRVNGVLRNFAPWYETFGVTPANALYLPPEARISIW
jgi:endothelin-converting enzyme/putative endopeptidase